MPYCYDHPHPAVAVDVVAFTYRNDDLEILLIRRDGAPFTGMWALPGGFVGIKESLRRAAFRELKEETGVNAGFLEQLRAFGRPDRDPRERVISVAYVALLPADSLEPVAASDAREARLFSAADPPPLAFDHARILAMARRRLREKLVASPLPLELMSEPFTLAELQRACELISGAGLDKRSFGRKARASGLIVATGEKRQSGRHRPALLYRAKQRRGGVGA